MIKFIDNQKGYIVSIVTIFVLIIMLSVAVSMSFLITNRQKNTTSTILSSQAYYASESGIEDALLRLKKTPQLSSSNFNLNVNNVTAVVDIPAVVGGSRNITSQANNVGMVRKLQVAYRMDGVSTQFYYGI